MLGAGGPVPPVLPSGEFSTGDGIALVVVMLGLVVFVTTLIIRSARAARVGGGTSGRDVERTYDRAA